MIVNYFISSLFYNGTIQVGKFKIVSWDNNDRHDKNIIWEKHKIQFENYGLLTKIKTENGDVFHQISNDLGATIWRAIVKKLNTNNVKPILKHEIKVIRRFSHISLSDLIRKRDSLENERKQIMKYVSRSQINNRGHYTSVKVKEGYAERLIPIIENMDYEIKIRGGE